MDRKRANNETIYIPQKHNQQSTTRFMLITFSVVLLLVSSKLCTVQCHVLIVIHAVLTEIPMLQKFAKQTRRQPKRQYEYRTVMKHTLSSHPVAVLLPVADPDRGRGACPPVGGLAIFCQYINIITKPTAYDGPREY